ncbi:hypothetical protein [uncultured Pontibacter sp.]|uniref:hypothetical protein n=1 Tax=uncultured Pontibacter sp. TaxID=453356 RepID=UPI00261A8F6E|nr:hypothetical protein [uncultured Pontibacter sp.]
MDQENKKEPNGSKDIKNWLEWTIFAISLIMVLTLLGYLVHQVYTDKPSSPDLLVQTVADPSEHAPFRHLVTIYNKGGTTAEEILVEIVLEKEGDVIEKAELQLPFSPQESTREVWVNFRENPAMADTLVTRVVSYKKP